MSEQPPPLISVIVPVRPTEDVGQVIASLAGVDYPSERFEVLVVRGTQPSRQRNEAIRNARGELVYFLDNDSVLDPHAFNRAVVHYADPNVVGVGGPNLALPARGLVPRAIDATFCSVFGTFRVKSRYASIGRVREATEQEIILCNMSMRKKVLDDEGGLNEELFPNEENELFSRLVRAGKGYKFIYAPDVVVRRPRSTNLGGYTKKICRYGTGRMGQTFARATPLCFLHMIPLYFLIYLIILAVVPSRLLAVPLLLYLALDVVFSVAAAAKGRDVPTGVLLLVLFPLTHIAYGVGLACGLVRALLRSKPRRGSVELVVYKRFAEPLRDATATQHP